MKKKDIENKMKMQQMQMQQMQQMLQKQQEMLDRQQTSQVSQNDGMRDMNSRFFNNEPMAANSRPPPQAIPASQLKNNVPDIRAPDQVKDILNRLHSIQPSKVSNTETQDETSSNNERLVSETTLSESNPRKKPQAKKKKGGLSIF